MPTSDPPPLMIRTSVDRLAVGEVEGARGGSPALLLWPSLFTDHRLYNLVVPLVRERWRVLRLDGPGFSDSDPSRSGLGDVLPRARAPLTILMGGKDHLYLPAVMRPLAGRAPGARVVVVPGRGHLLPLEAPEVPTPRSKRWPHGADRRRP